MASTVADYGAKFESFIDRALPTVGQPCPLWGCTAGKVFAVLAVLSLVGSMSSWSNFVGVLVWEVLLSLLVTWLCRTCRDKWVWGIVLVGAVMPFLIVAIFAILAMIAVKKI